MLERKYIIVVNTVASDATRVTMQFIRLDFNNWQVFCITAGLPLPEIVLLTVFISLLQKPSSKVLIFTRYVSSKTMSLSDFFLFRKPVHKQNYKYQDN